MFCFILFIYSFYRGMVQLKKASSKYIIRSSLKRSRELRRRSSWSSAPSGPRERPRKRVVDNDLTVKVTEVYTVYLFPFMSVILITIPTVTSKSEHKEEVLNQKIFSENMANK